MLKILILIFFLFLLYLLRHSLVPLLIGLAIAVVLDPYVDWLAAKFSGRRLAAVLTAYASVIAACILILCGFADIIAGKLSSGSLQEAASTLKSYYYQYEDVLSRLFAFPAKGPDLGKLIQSLGNGLIRFLVGMVAGIYLLCDKAFFLQLGSKALHLLLSQKIHGIVREICFEISQVIASFLRGVFVDSVVVAFLSSLALSIIGVEYAVLIGCFAGITNVIPYFGPVIGIIPAALSALSGGSMTRAVLAALSLFAIQQIECNFIYPRIIGRSTGLHPFFILAAVTIAGSLGGVLWMILAVPAAGIIKVLVTRWAQTQ